MIALAIITLSFIAYTVYLLKKYPNITSYSNSYYIQENPQLFLTWCCTMAFPMFYLTYGNLWGFLAGLGMLIVAVSAAYKNKFIGLFHYGGVAISALSSQIYMYNSLGWLANLISLSGTGLALLLGKKKRFFIAEACLFVSIIICLILEKR